jgi:hypothetical protein
MENLKVIKVRHAEFVEMLRHIVADILSERLGTTEQQIEGVRTVIRQELDSICDKLNTTTAIRPIDIPQTREKHSASVVRYVIESKWADLVDSFTDKPFTVRALTNYLSSVIELGSGDKEFVANQSITKFQHTVAKALKPEPWSNTAFGKIPFLHIARGEYMINPEFALFDPPLP